MPSHKIERIASEIAKEISDIILTEARDEILKTITITGCTVSKDLSYAKIYFTSLSPLDHKTLEKEVNEASAFLRGRLSERVDIRHTPKLKFLYDNSVAYGQKIEKIIKDLH